MRDDDFPGDKESFLVAIEHKGKDGSTPAHPIAAWARQRREALGLSRGDVAARMSKLGDDHVESNYVALIERGRIRLPSKRLRLFALALEVSENEVLRAAGISSEDDASTNSRRGSLNPFVPGTPRHEVVERLRELDDATAMRLMASLEFIAKHPTNEEQHEGGKDVISFINGAASGSHGRSAG